MFETGESEIVKIVGVLIYAAENLKLFFTAETRRSRRETRKNLCETPRNLCDSAVKNQNDAN